MESVDLEMTQVSEASPIEDNANVSVNENSETTMEENMVQPADSLLDSDNETEEPTIADTPSCSDKISDEDLRAEVARLREELAETRRMHERMATELGEFHALFPETDVASIPDGIWEQVRRGVPLAASYALYEKKCAMQKERAAAINLCNAQRTPGAAGTNTTAEYFSPEDVRAMSQAQVRANYQKILESMKKWNS